MINKDQQRRIIKMLNTIDIPHPKTIVILVSDTLELQGAIMGAIHLDQTKKVDLVAYLIKRLGITLTDIEETIELSDEHRYMMNLIKTRRLVP